MTTFYGKPYLIERIGFYFEDIVECDARIEKLNARGCEEMEIQFIDSDPQQYCLARSVGIKQATIAECFDELDNMENDELCALLGRDFSLDNRSPGTRSSAGPLETTLGS